MSTGADGAADDTKTMPIVTPNWTSSFRTTSTAATVEVDIMPHLARTPEGGSFGGYATALHDLGAPVLLGVSRKRFIGEIGGAPEAKDRLGGSLAVALHGASQGVHILRVHDTEATLQALRLYAALNRQETEDE